MKGVEYMRSVFLRLVLTAALISLIWALPGCEYIGPDINGEETQGTTTVTTGKKEDVKINAGDIESSSMLVEVLKLGKADCIIITSNGRTVMIDAGETDDKSNIFSKLILDKIEKIDYLIITHFDKDHIGAVPALLETYPVECIIEPDYQPLEPLIDEYTAYKSALASSSSTIMTLKDDFSFTLGDMSFEIRGPKGVDYSEHSIDNNNSLLVGLTHQGNSFLFAGDIEKYRIIDVLAEGIGHYDFLKVPHHGVNDSQSKEFINAVSPKYAVITCSEKNPADIVLIEKLKSIKAEVYMTYDGIVYAISSPSGLEVKQ